MSEFKNYHPLVNFFYFASVISFSMFVMHPVFLAISLITSLMQLYITGGTKKLTANIIYIIPLMLVTAIVNPAFNHEGTTILTYFPNGNPLTYESVCYGIATSCMLSSVICRFSSFNIIMTSDKIMYLTGKAVPSMSLVISMTLRFVPMFSARLTQIKNAQKCINAENENAGIKSKTKSAVKILSVMITQCLECSVETADSMKCRGFGTGKRSAFSNFKFTKRDGICFAAMFFLTAYVFAAGKIFKGFYFRYFPNIKNMRLDFFAVSSQSAYLLLCSVPLIIEIYEVYRWKQLKSKI